MAGGVNYNVNIAVNQTGARVVQRDLEAVGQTARSVAGSLSQLAAVAGIGFAVNDIIKYADAYQSVQNRLALVTTSTGNLGRVTDELYGISQRTRTSFEATAQIYSRFAQNTERLGLSQQQLLDVVETVNQTIAISGANSIEARNALIQFSQGLASGTLRGDELRSVLEQLPGLARQIAKGMGIAYEDLRKQAKDGKLTPEIILGALAKQAPEVAAQFQKLTPTISQAFTVLQNGITRFVGESGKAGGALGSVSGYVLALANNLNPLMNAIGTVGALMTAVFAVRMVAALATFNAAVGAFALTNPFTALLLGLTLLGAAAYTFGADVSAGIGQVGSSLEGGKAVAISYRDVLLGTFSVISANILATIESFNQFKDSISGIGTVIAGVDLASVFDGMSSGFEGFVMSTASELDGLFTLFQNVGPVISASWSSLTNFLSSTMVAAMNAVIGAVESAVNAIAGAINSVTSKVPGNIIPEIGQLKLGRVDAPAASSSGLGDFKVDRSTLATDAATKLRNDVAFQATKNAEARRVKQLEDEQGRDLNGPGKKGLPSADDPDGKGKKGRGKKGGKDDKDEFLEAQKKQLKDIKGPLDDYNLATRALDQLLKDGKITQEEYAGAIDKVRLKFLETQRDAMSGFEAGLRKVAEEATNVGKQVSEALVKGFDKAADALTDFVMTGKFNFSDFASSIVKDLIKIQIKSMILGPLAGMLGGTGTNGSGFASGLGGLFAKLFGGGSASDTAINNSGDASFDNIANSEWLGGFASGGQFKVGGGGGTDSQVVAFKASPNETVSIRRPDQMSDGSGGGQNVSVKVEHTGQTESTVQETRGADGSRLIKVMVDQAVNKVAGNARRGGTPLNQAFESRYGLNPAGGLT